MRSTTRAARITAATIPRAVTLRRQAAAAHAAGTRRVKNKTATSHGKPKNNRYAPLGAENIPTSLSVLPARTAGVPAPFFPFVSP